MMVRGPDQSSNQPGVEWEAPIWVHLREGFSGYRHDQAGLPRSLVGEER
jgi:hypothetical protein